MQMDGPPNGTKEKVVDGNQSKRQFRISEQKDSFVKWPKDEKSHLKTIEKDY